MGSHCENTHVINELQHPIYVGGLKDIVVAVSPDGITICQKRYTENIKKAVDNLTMIEVQCGYPLIEEDIERFPYE